MSKKKDQQAKKALAEALESAIIVNDDVGLKTEMGKKSLAIISTDANLYEKLVQKFSKVQVSSKGKTYKNRYIHPYMELQSCGIHTQIRPIEYAPKNGVHVPKVAGNVDISIFTTRITKNQILVENQRKMLRKTQM